MAELLKMNGRHRYPADVGGEGWRPFQVFNLWIPGNFPEIHTEK